MDYKDELDFERHLDGIKDLLDKMDNRVEELEEELKTEKEKVSNLDDQLEELKKELEIKKEEVSNLEDELESKTRLVHDLAAQYGHSFV